MDAPARREEKAGSPAVRFLLAAANVAAARAGRGRWLSLPWSWAALAGVNASTLALYGYDKAIAGGRRLRVPEAVLHVLALLGGTPSAFVGQQVFRHKTRKGSFQRVFWLTVFIQLALVAFWFWCRRFPP